MWTSLLYDKVCYLYNIEKANSNEVVAYVTDFKNIWVEIVDENTFIEKFKVP